MAICTCCSKVSEADSLVIAFIISGISIIRATWYPSQRQLTCAMLVNILCMILAIISMILTIVELSTFKSVSYRNYGQAKLGRQISRVLLSFYPLEVSMALTYSIFGCVGLCRKKEDARTADTEEVEDAF
ncbi:membrane-spanning 4-domains subfamily A member 13 isoform X2 [Bos indicus]|uniref:Membrane-spanning 4-domains subfamily A member 13 isoform X2 n=1 Tax=Bos indicus TaxID=9915 RepID=A0A6P5D228_BOSIN|nr:PREDICTED: membrane-spanning 4-domains subfamily A member 13 isoform X2 [Bos indicus]XP_024830843.1 membrane-spanning 4-domains subfamily A member 13 isoform X2 [Bos taurus]XP_027417999.1 membrane-spanning 4-domains subfamily A member 13 isoform X2 [Bos indicus x Bos taurus]XP_061237636.1 membrane-spanning 4-domains subfamily A member 13 isoform X2 [Bos javanicus]